MNTNTRHTWTILRHIHHTCTYYMIHIVYIQTYICIHDTSTSTLTYTHARTRDPQTRENIHKYFPDLVHVCSTAIFRSNPEPCWLCALTLFFCTKHFAVPSEMKCTPFWRWNGTALSVDFTNPSHTAVLLDGPDTAPLSFILVGG